MNDTIKFYIEMFPHLEPFLNEIKVWIDTQGNSFDEEEQDEILILIFNYTNSRNRVDTKTHIHSLFKKTYNERVKRAIPLVAKLALILLDGMSTKKGRALTDTLKDLVTHPEDYFYDTGNATANLDEINAFFSRVSIPQENKKELFTLLKK